MILPNKWQFLKKIDVYMLLSKFFVKDSLVPLDLCIAMENLFMIIVYWVSEHIVSTDIFNNSPMLTAHSVDDFLNNNNKQQIEWYSVNL